QKLIEQLSADEFRPEQYKDEYRGRLQEVVQQKVEGKEVTAAEPEQPRAQVIDLMEALKASLSRREGRGATRPAATAEPEAGGPGGGGQGAPRRHGAAPCGADAEASRREEVGGRSRARRARPVRLGAGGTHRGPAGAPAAGVRAGRAGVPRARRAWPAVVRL